MFNSSENADNTEKLMQVAHLLIQDANRAYNQEDTRENTKENTKENTRENTHKLNRAIEISRGISLGYLDRLLQNHVGDWNFGMNDENLILHKIMLDRAQTNEIGKTQPNYEMLAYSALILTGLPSASGSRENQQERKRQLSKATNLSRKAINGLMPAITRDLSYFYSCPTQDLATCAINDNLPVIPESLGHIPPGHVIAGYNGTGHEIIRGTVDAEYIITWVYGLAAQRHMMANEFLNQLLLDNKYTLRDKTNWTSDDRRLDGKGNRIKNPDGMSCTFDVVKHEDQLETETILVILNFAPNSPQILSGTFNNRNIFAHDYKDDDPDDCPDDCPGP